MVPRQPGEWHGMLPVVEPDEEMRRHRWEQRSEWPLMVAALLFLAAYAAPVIEPDLPNGVVGVASRIVTGTWLLFAVDYLIRLSLATRRWRFVRTHPLDLAVVALPLLRPLRLLRLLTLLSFVNRRARSSLRGQVIAYVAGLTCLVLLLASLALLDAERGREGANIEDFGDALWWSATTVTTVGYGDRFPVTGTGRLIAVALMLAGIALLGVVTAAFASWLIERVAEVEAAGQVATRRDLEALTAEVAALRSELRRQG